MAEYTDGLLTLTISTLDDEDYDGNPEQTKVVDVAIDGQHVAVEFSYEATDTDANIQTAVKAALTERGYAW